MLTGAFALWSARAPVGPLTGVVSRQARHLLFSTSLLGRFAGEWSALSWAHADLQACRVASAVEF